MGRPFGSKNHSAELKGRIIDLVKSGMMPTEFSKFYKISRNTVKTIVRRARKQILKIVPKKLGRKPKLGPRCVRRLLNFVKKKNRKPLFANAAQFRT